MRQPKRWAVLLRPIMEWRGDDFAEWPVLLAWNKLPEAPLSLVNIPAVRRTAYERFRVALTSKEIGATNSGNPSTEIKRGGQLSQSQQCIGPNAISDRAF